MYEALAWLAVLAGIGFMIWALMKDNTKRRNRTAQEFENDLVETRKSLLRAGMMELDKFVGETKGKRAAVEYLKDQEEGMHETGSKGDDQERTQDKSIN